MFIDLRDQGLGHGVELYENGLDNGAVHVAVDIEFPILSFLFELWIRHCSLNASRKAALMGERHVGRRDIGSRHALHRADQAADGRLLIGPAETLTSGTPSIAGRPVITS